MRTILDSFGTGIEPGKPERPFPLRPGTGFERGFLLDAEGEFPVTDETDLILIYVDNISCGHATFEILNAQMEGDFYGR